MKLVSFKENNWMFYIFNLYINIPLYININLYINIRLYKNIQFIYKYYKVKLKYLFVCAYFKEIE